MVEVRITYASRVFSFPDREVSVEDIADVMSRTSTGRSVSFSNLLFPVDVAALVNDGHDLSRATGEVLVDGVTIMSGMISEPEYGRAGEPVALTVSDDPYNDRGLVPKNIVYTYTIASVGVTDAGATVPMVFGRPCLWTDLNGDVQSRAGSPAPVLQRTTAGEARWLLIGDAPVDGLTHAGIIDSKGKRERFPLTGVTGTGLPRDGSIECYIALASVIGLTEEDAPYYVDYQAWSTTPYARGRDGRAGELIAFLLSKSTLTVDWGRFDAARGMLNRFLLAGYFDSPASPWQLINDHLNPILPISWLSGVDGIYPIAWDLNAAPTAQINNESRVSSVTYEGDAGDVVNHVVLKYTRAAHNKTYRRHMTVRDELSIANYGEASEVITCDVCSDKDTANRIARHILATRAWVHRSVSYEMENPPPVGSIVSVTDDDLALTNHAAIVRGVTHNNTNAARVDVLLITKGT
tara:strand:- start:3512 stop:4906 length:1395 start_codon:yes stop_codon:yes gene_type:complete